MLCRLVGRNCLHERRPTGRRGSHRSAQRGGFLVTFRDGWELASFVVTALGLPFAIAFFVWGERKERDNEDEEAYQLLSNAYNDFLKIVLQNADLRLRTNEPIPHPTPEQNERSLVIYDMLISLFERAYIVAWTENMSELEKRRWNSWDDFMREWCRRENFFNALPLLLRGEDPQFQKYILRVALEERGTHLIQTN
jgi:hypothetical protein